MDEELKQDEALEDQPEPAYEPEPMVKFDRGTKYTAEEVQALVATEIRRQAERLVDHVKPQIEGSLPVINEHLDALSVKLHLDITGLVLKERMMAEPETTQ